MKTLADRMELAKDVLSELGRQPIRRTDLEQVVIRKGATHARFEGILRFLADSGYIQKDNTAHFANYEVTEKGWKLLEALK